ncbi:helix-turn-helix domain-containing protein [Actinacidiphila glaucinigra]|uniref:MmyB family transcriptional regulator n=1 Tax=Actinacidiphila glaucinigra TaxID=235986 RepID=UPI0037B14B75
MDAHTTGAGTRNTALGDFLRSRRARISPERAGLAPEPTARRVPGLRREEIARLAGVSVDYYVRLERGHQVNASGTVLAALARALRLTDDERDHLFALARPERPAARPPAPQRVRPAVHRLLETMTDVPAVVVGRRTDVLAANRLARALYTDFDALPQRERNMARFIFLDEVARTLYDDWEGVARTSVAALRLYAGKHPHDSRLGELVGELSARDADFRAWWDDHDIRRRTYGVKHFHHPVVGELTLQYEALAVTGDPDQILGVYTAESATASERALRRLAEWAEDTWPPAGPSDFHT